MSRGVDCPLLSALLAALLSLFAGPAPVSAQDGAQQEGARGGPGLEAAPEPGGDAQEPHRGHKKAEEGAFLFLFGPGLLGLFAYPIGLAAHCLLLAYAPRRGWPLVHRLESHRWKTLLLGAANTVFLGIVFLATAQTVKALAILALVLWWALAFVGSHGLARGLGGRVLGHEPGVAPGPPGDLKALAVGWFVLVFGAAIPVVGLLLGLYWCLRGAGGVVLAVFSVPEPPVEPGLP